MDGDAGPNHDQQARRAFSERAGELYAALAEAEDHHDLGRIERLTGELDALTEALAQATGLGGRNRVAASSAERARSAVKQALRRALGRLRGELPDLADHLGRSIQTGALCRYAPGPFAPSLRVRRRP